MYRNLLCLNQDTHLIFLCKSMGKTVEYQSENTLLSVRTQVYKKVCIRYNYCDFFLKIYEYIWLMNENIVIVLGVLRHASPTSDPTTSVL